LPHSYPLFKQYIESNSLTYIGTRLHAGIKCLEQNHKSIIIAIDNRAIEIAKDTNLPICLRQDYTVLLEWLEGKNVFNNQLNIPEKEIALWKNQFSKYPLS
jgi:predicted transcriptional regulator